MKKIAELAAEIGEEFLNLSKIQPKVEVSVQKKFEWSFQTFGDKTLIYLFSSFKEFVEKDRKTFLTISGPTEIGKTYLLERCLEYYKTIELQPNIDFGYPLVLFKTWEEICNDCFSDRSAINKFEKCGRLLIDDLYPERTKNSFTDASHELAYKLLNKRLNKTTIITTNKTEQEILNIDVRVHSRLFRNEGKFIMCKAETKPFLERSK